MTDDLPYELAPFAPHETPAFATRLFAHLLAQSPIEEFTFEGADVTPMYGCWAVELGGYAAEDDPAAVPEQPGQVPSAPYARKTWDWLQAVRAALTATWGTPIDHALRLVGEEDQPEGILDVALMTLGMPSAELWDRNDVFAALLTGWFGEPGTGTLAQMLFVMPRALGVTDFATIAVGGPAEQALLARGEHPIELHRRAWTLAALVGEREVRVHTAAGSAGRIRVNGRSGEMTLWFFTDDGRILVVVNDPLSAFATESVAAFLDDVAEAARDSETAPGHDERGQGIESGLTDEDVRGILRERLLSDVPADLRALLSAPVPDAPRDADSASTESPAFTGAAWFDGATWWVSGAVIALGSRNGWGPEDFGFGDEFVRPYRLGGEWEREGFLRDGDAEQNASVDALFDAFPYPSQSRPNDASRLGGAMPSYDQIETILDDAERFTALWWDRSPDDAAWNDDSFRIIDRESRGDDRARTIILGSAWRWTADAFGDWATALFDAAVARWGEPQAATARVGDTGAMQRTPLSRILRAVGFPRTPLWWVNGHAVTLLAGFPDMELKAAEGHTDDALTDDEALIVLAVAKPDAIVDIAQGLGRPETRRRLSLISMLAGTPPEDLAVEGPALPGTSQVPPVSHGRLRADDRWWDWYLTHDSRGLLYSVPVAGDGPSRDDDERRALFSGVPEDLLALVPRRPHASGDGAPVWPDARAVMWFDGVDWRSSAGMLAEIRRAVEAGAPEGAPSHVDAIALWHDHDYGLRKLRWVLRSGEELTDAMLLDAAYATVAFPAPIEPDALAAARRSMGDALSQALSGTLSGFLAQWAREPEARFLLDAALSNPDPNARRDVSLWLLGQGLDASMQLSLITPLQVVLSNPTFGAADGELIERLLDSGARTDGGPVRGHGLAHPVRQIVDLALPEEEMLSVLDLLLNTLGAPDIALIGAIEADLERGTTSAQQAGYTRSRTRTRLREHRERLAGEDEGAPVPS